MKDEYCQDSIMENRARATLRTTSLYESPGSA
jgi:hypothetical protein